MQKLHIIEGLHSHDLGHEINNIANKQIDNKKDIGPCHACNSPHLAMNQYAINADQTLTAIHQPNALEKDSLTGNNSLLA